MAPEALPQDVLRFIADHVESVPHLETLLLMWETAPRPWTAQEVARRVYLPPERAELLLRDLVAKHWLVELSGAFRFEADSGDTEMIQRLAGYYRANLIGVAEAIHRKAPSAVLDFARAFQIRKDT